MPNERVTELMYDTAATLRLLDAELGELAPRKSADAAPLSDKNRTAEPGVSDRGLPLLPALLVRAMNEVHGMLASIRTGRETIRAGTTERLAQSSDKLNEVSSATANAALDIMDALERAVAKVDELETDAVIADDAKGHVIRGDLRDELFAVMGHMQFQDITSQQIMHVQSMLAELEGRLAEIANLFDNPNADHAVTHASTARPASRGLRATSRYDPGASLSDTESRQALADALVERGSGGG